MAYDYFTIAALASEMETALVGGEIAAVVEQRHDADADRLQQAALLMAVRPSRSQPITVTVTNRFGPGGEALHLDVPAAFPAARDGAGRSESVAVRSDGERYLRGATIVGVEFDRRERRITVRLSRLSADGTESFGKLVFELVHLRFQTALMAERSERVIGIWSLSRLGHRGGRSSDQRVRVGKPYVGAANTRLLPGVDDVSVFISLMKTEDQTDLLVRALTRNLCGADRYVTNTLLERVDIDAMRCVEDCGEHELRRFWHEASSMFASSPGPGSFTWIESGTAQFSSLEPAGRQAGADLVRHRTVSEAVVHWFSILHQSAHSSDNAATTRDVAIRHKVVKSMRARLRALERKRDAIQADLAEVDDGAECTKKGAVLLAHTGAITSGAERVELEDTFDASGNTTILIELDPQRSIADMAGRYLKRAAKLRKRAQVLPARLAHLDGEIARLRQAVSDCEQGRSTQDQIDSWTQERSQVDARNRPDREPQARPRRYRTSAGWIVWAGRNNRENDVLTHRLAAPEDIWFHAHGYAGSHVLLRRDGRVEQPSSTTVEEAAGVAAYWSKGRTASKVSVSYTAAKHVRKPRGAAPGLAVSSREKTILVRPKLLPEEDGAAPDQ